MLRISCQIYLNHQHSVTAYCSRCSPKRYIDGLKFSALSSLKEMTRILVLFTWESSQGKRCWREWRLKLSFSLAETDSRCVSWNAAARVQNFKRTPGHMYSKFSLFQTDQAYEVYIWFCCPKISGGNKFSEEISVTYSYGDRTHACVTDL